MSHQQSSLHLLSISSLCGHCTFSESLIRLPHVSVSSPQPSRFLQAFSSFHTLPQIAFIQRQERLLAVDLRVESQQDAGSFHELEEIAVQRRCVAGEDDSERQTVVSSSHGFGGVQREMKAREVTRLEKSLLNMQATNHMRTRKTSP